MGCRFSQNVPRLPLQETKASAYLSIHGPDHQTDENTAAVPWVVISLGMLLKSGVAVRQSTTNWEY